MRILIFHGYLLSGTGSNVYNARLAEALVRLGHEVHLFTQDRHPERHAFVGAAGDWDGGELVVRDVGGVRPAPAPAASQPGASQPAVSCPAAPRPATPMCTVYRPDIGGLLPLYVHDTYEGVQAKTFARCSDAEIAAYLHANVAAVREVAELVRPEAALANHVVMGPVILARALGGRIPYAVKVHGSALEYTVKPQPERFLGFAREGLAQAQTVLVGSLHTAHSLWRALADPRLQARTRLGPPGVDVERFHPRAPDPAQARAGIIQLVDRLRRGDETAPEERSSAFARDRRAAADALERVAEGEQVVGFVGKLIVSKGTDLLVAAWPLVLERLPHARLAVIGFGAYRRALELLVERLAAGDLRGAGEIARAGRALESSSPPTAEKGSPLRHLQAFLDSFDEPAAQAYRLAAAPLRERVIFTGRLDHEELAEVLPACEALVVPSTFPEAFGMVAAEAAACGALPISAAHSGLAEVSEALAREVPPQVAGWLSFAVDDDVVRAIAERVVAWLQADPGLKARTRERLVSVVSERWSWEGVARGVIGAARAGVGAPGGQSAARPFG
jgi:glycosyltransferase involved in cell wall biosynthesis